LRLEGLCHCGRMTFVVESKTRYPYRRCYCVRCRKTNGGSGYVINMTGETDTLQVEGWEHLRLYQPADEPLQSYFCVCCSHHLYILLSDWPQWVYPFASATDASLLSPPEVFHVLLDEAAAWVEVADGENHHLDKIQKSQ
jgi:hypothetical protein